MSLWLQFQTPNRQSVPSLRDMNRISNLAAFAKFHGLFRAASGLDVTCNLLRSMVRCHDLPSKFQALQKVSQVDLFISHSSKCTSWLKLLAIDHYLNLDWAIVCSVLCFILTIIVLVADAGSFSAVAQHQDILFRCFFVWPLLVFVSIYACGHLFSRRSFWFDQVCIDQRNLLLRCQALKAVPAFVANATGLVVLYDDTYFERLWCIYELAVHSRAGPLSATELIPTWWPIWTIFFIGMFALGVFFAEPTVAPKWDATSGSSLFMSVLDTKFYSVCMYPFIGSCVGWFCFEKLQRHRAMLDQLAQFDLRNAKCALETDRRVIEEQVLSLFDEACEPPVSVAFGTEETEPEEDFLLETIPDTIRHITSYPTNDVIIDQFNGYVRGPVRDKVLKSMGKEDYISFKICFVPALPWFFYSMTYVLGCDGTADCQTSASRGGFTSVAQYMTSNAIFCSFLAPLGTAMEFPPLLIACSYATEFVSHAASRIALCCCLASFLLFLGDTLLLIQRALLVCTMVQFSPLWLAGFIASVLLELFLAWYVFCKKQGAPPQRTLLRWKQHFKGWKRVNDVEGCRRDKSPWNCYELLLNSTSKAFKIPFGFVPVQQGILVLKWLVCSVCTLTNPDLCSLLAEELLPMTSITIHDTFFRGSCSSTFFPILCHKKRVDRVLLGVGFRDGCLQVLFWGKIPKKCQKCQQIGSGEKPPVAHLAMGETGAFWDAYRHLAECYKADVERLTATGAPAPPELPEAPEAPKAKLRGLGKGADLDDDLARLQGHKLQQILFSRAGGLADYNI